MKNPVFTDWVFYCIVIYRASKTLCKRYPQALSVVFLCLKDNSLHTPKLIRILAIMPRGWRSYNTLYGKAVRRAYSGFEPLGTLFIG